MPGEEHSARLVVRVDGRELAADVAPLLTAAVVDARRDAPSVFVLDLSDEHGTVLDKAGIRVGSTVDLSVQLAGSGGPTALLTGEVTSLEADLGPGGRRTTVRGYDRAHRLVGRRRTATFVNVSPSDVVRKVARDAGVTVGTVDAVGEVLDHVWQPNISDWDLLVRLADRYGATVGVRQGRLDFRLPPESSGAPGAGASARRDPFVVEQGVNLLALRATVSAASQVPRVEVRGWDRQEKQAVVGRAGAAARGAQVPGVAPGDLAAKVAAPALVVSSTRYATAAQASAGAKGVADRLGSGFAEIEATVLGNPRIDVGRPIALVGCGEPFDGRYVVSAVRHEIGADLGYRTYLTVSDASDRSTHGVLAGGAGPGDPWPGLLPGVVTGVKDPDGLGRVTVKLPVLDDGLETWWARVVQPGAGKDRGLFVLPEVGDEVLVAFAEGDLDQPYVLGGLFNRKDRPPAPAGVAAYVGDGDGAVTRRALVSRTGMHVQFVETPDDVRLVVSDKDGKQQVVLVQKPQAAVEIRSSGPVTVAADDTVEITAAKDVTCTSTSGNVTVKGTRVTLEGTSAIELKAPKVAISADAQLALKGATATLDGSATAEVTSAGVTTVKGSLVKIN
ncbi:VgrG-related protein [Cellulosimicrobium protaetiae]|uniref:VgrG-related protein n=1 Tax=Cellulosimicrobium protaetiae TaxID=2587808 RepID=A0A6M5UBT4_9MICO|nr:VgrG-related protein [Cellulosimicrobium protaetiae]QJW34871.1 VgrG-related protein [Cellulosimicrobium protaetiae]